MEYKCSCSNDTFKLETNELGGRQLITIICTSCGRVVTWDLKTEIN